MPSQSDLVRHSNNAVLNAQETLRKHRLRVQEKSRSRDLEARLALAQERLEASEAENTRLKAEIARLKPNGAQGGPKLRDLLSAREYQGLELLAQGLLYKEVADKLSISFETAHTYCRRLYSKLGVCSRSQAIVKFLNAR